MNHRITCQCEHVFDVTIPDSINLDEEPHYIEELYNGTFLRVTCPSCDMVLKPEFPLIIIWPSRKLELSVIPEFDRNAFYHEKYTISTPDVIIGYPEAADRIMVLKEGFDPHIIEALKYYLLLKAEETNPDAEISVWFSGRDSDTLEFHIHGLKTDEVAISRIPLSLYEKTLAAYKNDPTSEPFRSLQVGPYLSVQNLLRSQIE